MRKLLAAFAGTLLVLTSSAQKKWNLKEVVEYAMANNISVRLNGVQEKVAEANYLQNKRSQLPIGNFSGNVGLNSGSTQDPTSFGRTTQTFIGSGLQLQSSADIFNFYSKRNLIEASKWDAQAAKAATDKIRNDMALLAATGYLTVLLNKAQENVVKLQIDQTRAQLGITRKQVDAGALPELNATQLDAQLAIDSINYLTAKGATAASALDLKTSMSLDPAEPFDIETPPVDLIPVEPLASLQPDYVYNMALQNMPQQRVNKLRLLSAEKNAAAAKAQRYPSLSAYGSLGTNFNSRSQEVTSVIKTTSTVPTGTVVVGSQTYDVNSQVTSSNPVFNNVTFTNQLSDNFRQSVGLSVSVPILSGGALRGNYTRSKLNINTIQLQQEQDNLKLKQDIYQAYTAALIAYEKFNAAKKSVEINDRNVFYAQKRNEAGMLGSLDLINTQNNLFRSRLEMVSAQFDYVFRVKVLEFYKGQGLKL